MVLRAPRFSRKAQYCFRLLLLPLLVLALALRFTDRLAPALVDARLTSAKSVLWVTAHPDDESFFFGPTLSSLLAPERGVTGHLLCLSAGDHEGLGSVRRSELRASCEAFGIAGDNCVSLDHPALPDDPDLWWPPETIEQLVKEHVKRWDVDLIITFDDYGVSGHANHRAVSSALGLAAASSPSFPPIFAVLSTSVLLKFTSLLSLPSFTILHFLRRLLPSTSPTSLLINSLSQYRQARLSFDQHQSQWRWFRSLFVTFSRYLWFVELKELGV
ncbi:putative deacetylase LmbE-like domain-containing protein [Leucosporidium creatinivorum]|uniref:N-acetylglucosaminylphosphatidylinositol deacetylase n=1 Tax=Leucosporidium creatinivorum TaxID=106004 RepID=A0A1Y2F0P3_9BASI|nr:putative deacetylase LmbE-like domain-containing protein [Leucosporidium creatinivorum]